MRHCITDNSVDFLFVSSPLSINSQVAFYCIPSYAVYLLPWYVHAEVVEVPWGFTFLVFFLTEIPVFKKKFV